MKKKKIIRLSVPIPIIRHILGKLPDGLDLLIIAISKKINRMCWKVYLDSLHSQIDFSIWFKDWDWIIPNCSKPGFHFVFNEHEYIKVKIGGKDYEVNV